MRILLIQPEYRTEGIGFRLAAMPEPLHLELVAALAPGHDVRILDMRLDADLAGALGDFAPDLVGVTALTPEVYAAQEILRQVKQFSPDIFTVVGGHHASLLPEDFFLPQVDAIATGEAELVFPQLLEAVEHGRPLAQVPNLVWRNGDGQFQRNPAGGWALDMDALPLPRRDLTQHYRDEYFFLFDKPDTSIATGRGCPYRCNFCSVWEFYGGRTRQMSAQRVMKEIASVRTDHITFVDDNFLLNARRERAIADAIRAEGIRRRFSMECRTDSIARHPELIRQWVDVGLYAVLLGLEGPDGMLQRVGKSNTAAVNDRAIRILQDHGVIIWGAFIIDPDFSEEDFQQLADYVAERHITHTQFTILTPLPGTQLYRQRYDELLSHDYRCFDTLHAVLPTRLPREVFYQRFANLYRQRSLGPYYDLVQAGKMSIDDCRRGKAMLDAMTCWERYLLNDPVLGSAPARQPGQGPSRPAALHPQAEA